MRNGQYDNKLIYMCVLKERLLYYRATDAVGEISLKRVIANETDKAKIISACHDGVHVDGCHYTAETKRVQR